jgi:hypothetical protein
MTGENQLLLPQDLHTDSVAHNTPHTINGSIDKKKKKKKKKTFNVKVNRRRVGPYLLTPAFKTLRSEDHK